MLSAALRCPRYHLRVFAQSFSLTNAGWTVEASLAPPTLQFEQSARIKYGASLLLSVYATSSKFQKGRSTEFYPLRVRPMMELASWQPPATFEHVNESKVVLLRT
jgi:hypothetical protein